MSARQRIDGENATGYGPLEGPPVASPSPAAERISTGGLTVWDDVRSLAVTAPLRSRCLLDGVRNAAVTVTEDAREMASERTALLIIRAWIEPGSDLPLRVHLRHALDVSLGFEGAFQLADADQVVDLVRAWLVRVQEG